MNDTNPNVTANDFLKALLNDTTMLGSAMTLEKAISIVITLLVALAAGFLIYFIYRKLFRGVVYSQGFAATLVGMTVLTCMVTLALGTNIVLSLGMVGALSIVRYRTAIKEPIDLLYLFWAITAGITIGATLYFLVAAASAALIVVLLILSRARRDQSFVMVIHHDGGELTAELARVLGKMRYTIRSRTLRAQDSELVVEVRARRNDVSFADQVRALAGVEDVTLVQYNGEYSG